eukprot:scaffold865_cov87-Cylindrotheca_fusiformis.AAC.2
MILRPAPMSCDIDIDPYLTRSIVDQRVPVCPFASKNYEFPYTFWGKVTTTRNNEKPCWASL